MTKRFLTFGILIVVLGVFFVPAHFAHAQGVVSSALGDLVDSLFKGIAQILMLLSALVLMVCGKLFDWIVNFTIIDMAQNIGSNGIGDSITAAWATLRDIANMCFIFVLLYAAFKAMFDTQFGNFQTTIKNIIIIALLINFSLFFSKVVIDASNIVSVGFYKSTVNNTANVNVNGGPSSSISGISGGYMNMLRLQTFYSPDFLNGNLSASSILAIGVMSTLFMLITAVILLMAGVMFAARFVILVFLMILSPLAFIAYTIPGLNNRFWDWFHSLIDQSFFAPIYFALTWVVFKLGTSLLSVIDKAQVSNGSAPGVWANLTSTPDSVIPLIVNYVLIMGFSIAALIFSKQMASKGAAGAAFGKITGTVGGVVGGATIGTMGAIGRQSFGRMGTGIAQSSTLRDTAAKGGVRGFFAKGVLQAGAAAGGATYDARGSKFVKGITRGALGDLGEERKSAKGGYSERTEGEQEKEFAKKFLGATPQERILQKEKMEESKETKKAQDDLETEVKTRNEKIEKIKSDMQNRPFYEQQQYKTQIVELEKAQTEAKTKLGKLTKLTTDLSTEAERLKNVSKTRGETFATSTEERYVNRILGTNKRIALALREEAQSKKKKNKAAEKIFDIMEGKEEEGEKPKEEPATPTQTPNPNP
jgi:hypothetical protein